MPDSTTQQWATARAVAEEFVAKHHPNTKDAGLVRNPRVPFLFRVYVPGRSWLLVHGGSVVQSRGLEGLANYLEATRAAERAAITTADALALLSVFDAYPPVHDEDGDRSDFVYMMSHALLEPSMQWSEEGGKLVLVYRVKTPVGGGGGRRNPEIEPVAVWTLTISSGYRLAWSRKVRRHDRVHDRFVE